MLIKGQQRYTITLSAMVKVNYVTTIAAPPGLTDMEIQNLARKVRPYFLPDAYAIVDDEEWKHLPAVVESILPTENKSDFSAAHNEDGEISLIGVHLGSGFDIGNGYRYIEDDGIPLTTCPNCACDLMEDDSVSVECKDGDNIYVLLTSLDEDGVLIDVEENVFNGWAHVVSCSHCLKELKEWEEEFEVLLDNPSVEIPSSEEEGD